MIVHIIIIAVITAIKGKAILHGIVRHLRLYSAQVFSPELTCHFINNTIIILFVQRDATVVRVTTKQLKRQENNNTIFRRNIYVSLFSALYDLPILTD